MEISPSQAGQAQGIGAQGAGMINDANVSAETKRKVYYGIISFLIFTLSGALGYFVNGNSTGLYLFYILLFSGLGILHLFLIKWLNLFGNDNTFASRVLYSIVIVLLSMIGFFISFYFLSHKSGFSFYFTISLWYLMVPMAVVRCFDLALAVPAKIYKEWYYPAKPIIADMDKFDLSNFAIITYVFSKKEGDTEKSNFQTKAPYDIKLGDLFYFFINEWNRKYPQGNIQYTDEQANTFGWLFYVKDKWYQPKKFLDPDKTVRENNINVNQIIQTLRIPQPAQDSSK